MPSLILPERPTAAPQVQTHPSQRRKLGTRGPRAYRGWSEFWKYGDRHIHWMKSSGYSEMTIKGAWANLSWFFRWLESKGINRAADVTPEVLEHYSFSLRERRNGLEPNANTIASRLYAVRAFFQWLASEAVIIYDPTDDLAIPKRPLELPHVILTQQEARKLMDAPDLRSPVGYRDKAMLELAYASGVRTAEFIALKVPDVDLKTNIVHVKLGKGKKDRDVPVPPLTMRWVREYIEKIRPGFAKRRPVEDGRLWLNYTGGVVDKNRLCGVFKQYRKLAGLDKHVTMLTLRHSIASHLLENGMEIRYIQEILGHDRLSTTQIYSKVTLTGLDKHFRRTHPRERDWAKAKK